MKKMIKLLVALLATVGLTVGILASSPEMRMHLTSLASSVNFEVGSGSKGTEHSDASHTKQHPNDAKDGQKERSTHDHGDHSHHPRHKIVTTNPIARDVILTKPFVCQIHSRRHIDVKALEGGYLESIHVNEGQLVKKGDVMFHLLPTLYAAKLDADMAEAQLAQVEYDNTNSLVNQNIVSSQELKLAKAKLEKALAQVKIARAEMNFADIRAPFDGIIDRLHEQEGSLIEEGSMLTTMSDNSVMWVYFNVPEKYYLAFQKAARNGQNRDDLMVRLKLANQELFDHEGTIGAIEADFDNETGNISFRADFPNPDGLLRHGQTGTVLIDQKESNAIVIPQRATYEILAKKYVFVVDDENIVHQREIEIAHELEDVFLVGKGLQEEDKIVLEGVLQVRDGDEVESEFLEPSKVMSELKYHAE